jgi:hypothetical protein
MLAIIGRLIIKKIIFTPFFNGKKTALLKIYKEPKKKILSFVTFGI